MLRWPSPSGRVQGPVGCSYARWCAMTMRRGEGGAGSLVYSTDGGRMCPDCRRPMAQCLCRPTPSTVDGDGIVRIGREKKGRGGKTVTLVTGLALAPDALRAVAKQLKSDCGSGGTVADGRIEIQGDHVERVLQALRAQGFRVRRTGG